LSNDLDGLYLSINNTCRGFGDHHRMGSFSLNHGKMPNLYDERIRSIFNSADIPTRPSSEIFAKLILLKSDGSLINKILFSMMFIINE
jgi:hypothetical protein